MAPPSTPPGASLPSLLLLPLLLPLLLHTAQAQAEEATLEDLVYDYYGGWSGHQARGQMDLQYDDAVVIDSDLMEGAPPAVKDDFGATLSGMMGALAEIQSKGDSMLAGIRRQREVLTQLEERAAAAEQRRQQEESAIMELEAMREELEVHVIEMEGAQSKISETKSALAPLLNQVSTRTVELRNFESLISTKKSELENVSKKVEEANKQLSSLSSSSLVGGSSPALLALLAGSLIFNLAAGSQLASTFLEKREGGGLETFTSQLSPLRQELRELAMPLTEDLRELAMPLRQDLRDLASPLKEDLNNLASFLGSQGGLRAKRRKAAEQRFKDKYSEEVYYELPRAL